MAGSSAARGKRVEKRVAHRLIDGVQRAGPVDQQMQRAAMARDVENAGWLARGVLGWQPASVFGAGLQRGEGQGFQRQCLQRR